MNTKTQEVAHKIADMFYDLELIILLGNHDTYYKNKANPTSLKLFRKYKSIQIINYPLAFQDNIYLIPWGCEIQPTHYKYCMGHFEINGFHMNDTYICKKGIDESSFDQFKKVFSGHFHTPSKKGKITYLGSPFQQTFHDTNSKRGYYIFEDGNLEFIEFNKYPHFYKMSTDKIDYSLVNGNIIKLTFNKDYGTEKNEKIIESVSRKEPHQIYVDFSKISYDVENEIEEDVPDIINHNEILKDYIEKTEKPVNIKDKTLMEIIFKLKEELQNE
jgi:hypothetical protein